MHTRCYHSDAFLGRLAQLVERHVHTVEVIGSRPVSPTENALVRACFAESVELAVVSRCTPGAQDFAALRRTRRSQTHATARKDIRQHRGSHRPG